MELIVKNKNDLRETPMSVYDGFYTTCSVIDRSSSRRSKTIILKFESKTVAWR